MTNQATGAVPAPGSDAEDDDPEVCLVCGKPGRGQPCDDCLAELDSLTMRPRTDAETGGRDVD